MFNCKLFEALELYKFCLVFVGSPWPVSYQKPFCITDFEINFKFLATVWQHYLAILGKQVSVWAEWVLLFKLNTSFHTFTTGHSLNAQGLIFFLSWHKKTSLLKFFLLHVTLHLKLLWRVSTYQPWNIKSKSTLNRRCHLPCKMHLIHKNTVTENSHLPSTVNTSNQNDIFHLTLPPILYECKADHLHAFKSI